MLFGSVKSPEMIGKFLKKHAKVPGIGFYSGNKFLPKAKLIYADTVAGVVSLIREAHSQGVRVTEVDRAQI